MVYGKPSIARGGIGYKFVDSSGILYAVHVFKSSSIFTCYYNNLNIDCMIVGGGGSGGLGNSPAGGGGAGGLVFLENQTISQSSHAIIVGAANGNSTAFNYTALAGGGGASAYSNGSNGGSGGGSSSYKTDQTPTVGGSGLQPSSTPNVGYGNNGGGGSGYGFNANGGGAGSAGTSSSYSGSGLYFGDKFGDNYGESGYFAGGGAGLGLKYPGIGNGGRSGTGAFNWGASQYTESTTAQNPIINSGGGGNAVHVTDYVHRDARRLGSSGIVMIRYQI